MDDGANLRLLSRPCLEKTLKKPLNSGIARGLGRSPRERLSSNALERLASEGAK
jgi:hypothetical protein